MKGRKDDDGSSNAEYCPEGVLFAMLIVRAPAGDRRNWKAIRAWAAAVADLVVTENKEAPAVAG